jgi:protein-L-isoaspartate(D-aspartate) O-methyltransferase
MNIVDKKELLIRNLISGGYLKSSPVIHAFREIRREDFVSPADRDYAYSDQPLHIKSGQTISAPHMVAAMTELINPDEQDRVLEVGAGSGYQAAILSRLVSKVFSIELEPGLVSLARRNLKKAGVGNVEVIQGDGSEGLPEKAPFDKIIVTCASGRVYPAWKEQLKQGGVLLVPLERGAYQELTLIRKTKSGFDKKELMSVVFVPLRRVPAGA